MPITQQISAWTLLAGDVGATKTSLAIIPEGSDARESSQLRTFQNKDYADFQELLREYLGQRSENVQAICLGVAGPVYEGRAELTNQAWTIDTNELQHEFNLEKVWMLNDLQATAHAIPLLRKNELGTLNAGKDDPGGKIAVIAPGTGLGEAFLTFEKGDYHAQASEGSHSDFGARNVLQDELLKYMREHSDHVSYESVCSGIGLQNIYNFLKDSGRAEEPSWLKEKAAENPDMTPIIVDGAMDKEKECEICLQSLEIFTEILGAETGNLALKVGATGGVYIGGGIPPRILPLLEAGTLITAFMDKGHYKGYLKRFPVHVILNTETALLGAADYGIQNIRSL